MKSYIVRIFRVEQEKPRRIVGIVEKVGEPYRLAFTNYDELWRILNAGEENIAARQGSKFGVAETAE